MLIIPAVDIRKDKCVQLVGGKPGTGQEYGSPLKAAQKWEEEGAEFLHIVDLDAAMNEGSNLKKIREILSNIQIKAQVSGGIRSIERANDLLNSGAERIIIGTAAFSNERMIEDMIDLEEADKIWIALDVKKGEIAVEGWKRGVGSKMIESAKEFEEIGVGGFLFTNIDLEGRMTGIDPEPIRKLVDSVEIPIIAAGGVKSIDDVKRAKNAGSSALVIGTALYESKIKLKKAMKVAK